MEGILNWLSKIERLAEVTYKDASFFFSDNIELAKLLKQLSEDEAWHFQLMNKVRDVNKNHPLPLSSIIIDDETRNEIENTFFIISEKMRNNSLTEKDMLDLLISFEFSEWNDVFLYVVSYLEDKTPEFKLIASQIQNHIKIIEKFLSTSSYGSELIKKINDLQPIWTENILIVDDDPIVAKFIKHLLNKDGNIDIAVNGQEGIEAIKNKYYKLIISDIDMPVMDGISFFKNAKKMFPNIHEKLLFMSGDLSSERIEYLKINNLRYLPKPSPIRNIRNESLNLLLSRKSGYQDKQISFNI